MKLVEWNALLRVHPRKRSSRDNLCWRTNDLIRRVHEHWTDAVPGFTRKHGVHRLVYYEVHDDIDEAILREKRLKRWARAWKIELIEKQNEDWNDLWPTLAAGGD